MTYETIMYGIKCNRCQQIYEDGEGANLAVDRHGDLEESAQEDGWYVNGDRHYCPNCHTINENDEVVTKPLIDYYFSSSRMYCRCLPVGNTLSLKRKPSLC